jgi:hypothetical protein
MQAFNMFIASTLQPGYAPVGPPERFTDDEAAYDGVRRQGLESAVRNLLVIENMVRGALGSRRQL